MLTAYLAFYRIHCKWLFSRTNITRSTQAVKVHSIQPLNWIVACETVLLLVSSSQFLLLIVPAAAGDYVPDKVINSLISFFNICLIFVCNLDKFLDFGRNPKANRT